ncbi:MAG: MFS transporter [Cytophagales bacterium]|nr:MFS transporter [Armatimonadota bacterium]
MPWPFMAAMALIALLAELAYGVVNNSTMPVYVRNGLGLPNIVGFVGASFLLAEALLNGPTGILADRYGRRLLMVIGPLLSVFTCVCTALLRIPDQGTGQAIGIGILVTLRFLDGAGAAALWPAVFASIGDRVNEKQRSTAMGLLNVSYMIGLAIGPLIGGLLNDTIAARLNLSLNNPWRYAPSFGFAAVAFLIAAVVAFLVVPSHSAHLAARRAEAEERKDTEAVDNPHGETVTWKAITESLRRIPMLLLLVFVIFLGIGLIALNVKFYAMDRLKVTETGFGGLLLWPALVVAAVSAPLGRLGDKWGKARTIQLGMAIASASMWLIIKYESQAALIVLGSLLGVGFVLAFPAYMALLSDISGPKTRGSVIGAVKAFQGIGMLIGGVFGPPIYQWRPLAPFIGAGILLTAGFLLSLLTIRDPKPLPPDE